MTNLQFSLPVDANQELVPWRNLRTLLDYNASNNLQYIGMAMPGSLSASAVWQVKEVKYEVVNSGDLISSITFADGIPSFTKTWDDRTGYVYL